MRVQACAPCAKRKVRCDKGEPCSNCKRRKQDHCTYPETSSTERIQELESMVRELGGAPKPADAPLVFHIESGVRKYQARARADGMEDRHDYPFKRSSRPVITEGNEEAAYRESGVWPNLVRDSDEAEGRVRISHEGGQTSVPASATKFPGAFASVLHCDNTVDFSKSHVHPSRAEKLWDVFFERVDPISKISFKQEWDRLRSASLRPSQGQGLSATEHAMLFAIFFVSIKSLSTEECLETFSYTSANLLSEYQILCENALIACNFLCSSDVRVLEAIVFYLIAGLEILDTRSLWSLMGMIIRSAERLGLHRDGSLLGLSPYETERRRRLWWHLQHLDLIMGVKFGSTSLTLGAVWDVKLPSNIEDDDISPIMQEFPDERKESTGMSFCLWTYWIIAEQRAIAATNDRLSWISWTMTDALSQDRKDEIVKRLESDANAKFIQYCDPSKPLDVLTHIGARAVICQMRFSILHSQAVGKRMSNLSEKHRTALFEESKRSIDYDIATHGNQLIRHFRWRTTFYFPWSRFVYVLAETCQSNDTKRTAELWRLLTKLYSTNPDLLNLHKDRRNAYAAELLVGAWKARLELHLKRSQTQRAFDVPLIQPDFIGRLEDCLCHKHNTDKAHQFSEVESNAEGQHPSQVQDISTHSPALESTATWTVDTEATSMRETHFESTSLSDNSELNLDDIDWSFWCDLDNTI